MTEDNNIAITTVDLDKNKLHCNQCRAACCKLEVMLITETGVPEEHIARDRWGGESMLQLDDGWCSALNRTTLLCTIYEKRPWVCREFEMSSPECHDEFIAR